MAKRAVDPYFQYFRSGVGAADVFGNAMLLACASATFLLWLRYFLGGPVIGRWMWIALTLIIFAGLLYISACLMRRGAYKNSIVLSHEGLHYCRLGEAPVLVSWDGIRSVTDTTLALESWSGKYTVTLDDGAIVVLPEHLYIEAHATWVMRLAGMIPETVPILPAESPLARARRLGPMLGREFVLRRSWVIRYAERETIVAELIMFPIAAMTLPALVWSSPSESWIPFAAATLFSAFMAYGLVQSVYLFSGAKYRTLLFFGKRRIARIAPTGTTVLTAPYAGFRAWPPAFLGVDGEMLPLTLFGSTPSRVQLERILQDLPEGDPARLDLERYLLVSSESHRAYYQATLLLCAGVYVSATAVAFSCFWLVVPGALLLMTVGFGLLKRARAIYRIGRD